MVKSASGLLTDAEEVPVAELEETAVPELVPVALELVTLLELEFVIPVLELDVINVEEL